MRLSLVLLLLIFSFLSIYKLSLIYCRPLNTSLVQIRSIDRIGLNFYSSCKRIDISLYVASQALFFSLATLSLLIQSYINFAKPVSFVPFDTDLCTYKRCMTSNSHAFITPHLMLFLFVLLVHESRLIFFLVFLPVNLPPDVCQMC